MKNATQNEIVPDTRLEWVEPEMRQLDVRETAMNNGTGMDGNGVGAFADCTKS